MPDFGASEDAVNLDAHIEASDDEEEACLWAWGYHSEHTCENGLDDHPRGVHECICGATKDVD